MDVVNVILQPIVDSLMVPIKKHIGFMTSCKKYVGDMENSMTVLKATRDDVTHHMKQNECSHLEIPARVPGWLEEVTEVDVEVNSISSNVGSCFSFKTRHDVGEKAFKLIQDIKRLTEERIVWTNHPIPLGKVDSIKASTSTPSVEYHSDYESREETFMKALKALEPDHKSHMIALCGMGGVGKTTMMEKLKTVVEEKRIFSLIVKVVVGEKIDPFAIQDAVADYLAIDLKERTIPARADKLRKWFKNYSEGGKKKILVILDDIWQLVDLNDIGLSPFPDQGVEFKILLTSRSRDVCTRMGVEAKSMCDVDVLAKVEAQSFFWKFLKDSDEADMDPDFLKVGDDIVSRCQGLPIAIKTIAYTLKGKSKGVWEDTLTRLQHHDIHEIVNEVFELSYKNLEDEQAKSVLLLCGLYPEDFDIPTEDLVRYGWGLKLFKKVYTTRQARNRLNSCIEQLINANLLIESTNRAGRIKMHDLVRAFVLKMYTKFEHASMVNHGNMSEWPANDTPGSCKRISLVCKGMEEFPRDFKYPNLTFLKLTHGDKSPRFPENFYGLMEKLQVIVFEKMKYPLLPRSFEYSTNLRTLCLHECSLMFDCHSIGSLSNLEVLSFANCSIQKLPSTVGNLKELKLLDLTGCVNLHIDDGVLKNLVKLEELYMRVAHEKAISFTDGNFNELADRSKSLTAIEIELFRKNAHPKRMSFINLERFKISIGRFLEKKDEKTTFENTLMLVSNKSELLESRINLLFEKTVVLHFEVADMNNLEDLKCSSFHRLRVLNISKCAQLRYLFTGRVASTLSRLEHLKVWSCDTLQTLIHDEDNGSETIRFPSLKFLSFGGLPKLVGLCNTRRVIELPQLMELRLDDLPDFTSIFPDDNLASSSMSSDTSAMKPFLNEEVAIPKLETLRIRRMNKLSKIWSSEVTRSENVCFSMLKTIEVEECDRLVNVFPRNPMPLLHHLKQLSVKRCRSIKTIFTANFNLKTLQEIDIDYGEISLVESGHELQNNAISRDIAFSSHLIHTFHQLRTLTLKHDREAQMVFDIESASSGELSTSQNNHHQLLSSLEDLTLSCMNSMSHLWKCNWNLFFILQQPKSLCQNLTKITLKECRSIKYLFSPLMFKFLSNLKCVHVEDCEFMEEIVSNRDDKDEEMATSTSTHTNVEFSPILEWLNLICLKSLQHIGGSGGSRNSIYNRFQPQQEEEVVALRWSLCQYSRYIDIKECSALSSAIPSYALGHMQYLEQLQILDCDSMKEVFQIERVVVNDVASRPGEGTGAGDNNNNTSSSSSVVSSLTNTTTTILPDLRNLWSLYIYNCPLLRDVFPFSTLQSLTKLKHLEISCCDEIRVIVKEDGNHTTPSSSSDDHQVLVFPCLKSLELINLPKLESFFLGTNDFQWPVLDTVYIDDCPNMRMFTKGHSDSPLLKSVRSDMGENSVVECGLNNLFHHPITTTTGAFLQEEEEEEEEEVPYPSLDGSTSLPFSERMPWFYNNLIKVQVFGRQNRRFIIGHNELQHMLKIEKIKISWCSGVKEIFETSEMNNGLNQTHSVVEVREMEFEWLSDIKCLWKSKQWRVLKFPNLTRLSIDHCKGLKHVFTISMVGSLLQLQELHIRRCREMETILADVEEKDEEDEKEQNKDTKEDEVDDERRVNGDHGKEEQDNDERRVNEVEFPCLRMLTISNLRSLKGFCLGFETIHWPSLDTLEIKECPEITTFTNGESTTPKLKLIETSFGLCDATEGVNSFIRTNIEEGYKFGEVEET